MSLEKILRENKARTVLDLTCGTGTRVLRLANTCEYSCDLEEFSEIKWFRLDELPLDRADPHLARFCEKLSQMYLFEIVSSLQEQSLKDKW